MEAREMRIGNFYHWEAEGKKYEPIALTDDWALKLGFEKLPHQTITNSLIKKIGRNRIISIGNVGTPNEMIWLCEVNATDDKTIDDLVCIRNFDYDGYTMVHTLQNICDALNPPQSNNNSNIQNKNYE